MPQAQKKESNLTIKREYLYQKEQPVRVAKKESQVSFNEDILHAT